MTAEADHPKKVAVNGKWVQIAGAIAGAVVIGLQGINLNELGTVSEQGRQRAEALKGIEHSIEQNLRILEAVETSIKQNSDLLANGNKLLQHDGEALENQRRILDLLEKNLEARRAEHP